MIWEKRFYGCLTRHDEGLHHVEWNFLCTIMGKMGFYSAWVDLIMQCITIVSYSVLVNDRNGSEFKLIRDYVKGAQ